MATETIRRVTDDLDGSSDAKTIPFAFGGTTYEIDLSKSNEKAFEKAMAPYLAAARRAPSGRGGSRRGAARSGAARSAGPKRASGAVREWARSNGIEINARGRIPEAIIEQFEASQAQGASTSGSRGPRKRAARTAKK